MLTAAQKSAVRRHLEYPVVGLLRSSPAGGSLGAPFSGYRFFQTYGRLEYKLNNLNADEEARLTGLAYGAVAIVGPSPNPGDQVSITLQGGTIGAPVVLSVTTQPGDIPVTLVLRLAAAAALSPTLQTAKLYAVSPYGTGPFSQNELPLAEVAFVAPKPFQLVNASGTGILIPQVTADGNFLSPSASLDGGDSTLWGYLPILDGLESAWAGASDDLDIMKAGPWVGRANEIGQRLVLYQNWQERLSRFLEIPVYDGTGSPRRGRMVSTTRYA